MVKKITVIAFSLCFLVSNNSIHGMELFKSILRGKPIRRETITDEEKEFHDLNACKEYIRSLDEDVTISGVSGLVKIRYTRPGSEDECKTSAYINSHDNQNPNSIMVTKHPMTFVAQLENQLKSCEPHIEQVLRIEMSVIYYKEAIQPS